MIMYLLDSSYFRAYQVMGFLITYKNYISMFLPYRVRLSCSLIAWTRWSLFCLTSMTCKSVYYFRSKSSRSVLLWMIIWLFAKGLTSAKMTMRRGHQRTWDRCCLVSELSLPLTRWESEWWQIFLVSFILFAEIHRSGRQLSLYHAGEKNKQKNRTNRGLFKKKLK